MLRRRIMSWTLGAAVTAALGASPAVAAEAGNLLANPSFEEPLAGHDWMPAGWDTTQAGLPTVFFGRDTILAHSGRYSISVASASGVWAIEHGWSQSLWVGPADWGKDYVLTLWTRSIGIEGRGYVVLQALRDSVGKMAREWGVDRDAAERRMRVTRFDMPAYALGWQRAVLLDNETDWVKHELRIHVPPAVTVVTVRAGVLGVGQLYIDDVSLTTAPARTPIEPEPGVNLIADPSFEGDLREWEISRPPFPGLVGEQVTDIVHSGDKSFRFSGTGGLVNGRAGVAQVFGNHALGGKRLRLTAYAKAESLLSNAYARIYCHTPRGVFQDVSTTPVTGTRDWTKLEVELDAPEDAYCVWAWLAYTAPSPGAVWFDDMSFEVVGPARGPGKPADATPAGGKP